MQTHNDSQETNVAMDQEKLLERIHALEVAQATQAAVQAGAVATNTAAQAGAVATNAAAQAGTIGTMIAGSAGLVVGIFLGLALRTTK